MKVYGITTCGSVKKALSFLKARGKVCEFVDLKKVAIEEERLRTWIQKQPLHVIFNTKGTKFKTLGLAKDLDDEAKVQWLLKEQLLFKRPIIECDDGSLVVGFDEALYTKLF